MEIGFGFVALAAKLQVFRHMQNGTRQRSNSNYTRAEMAPKTQMWVGIALIGAAIFFIGFEETGSGRIQWRSDALTLIAGLYIALQGYYRLQKQRNVPTEAGTEPKIKNQMFLKRPWLFPVLTGIIVLAISFALIPLQDASVHARVFSAIVLFSIVNIRFFLVLRRTRRLERAVETSSK